MARRNLKQEHKRKIHHKALVRKSMTRSIPQAPINTLRINTNTRAKAAR